MQGKNRLRRAGFVLFVIYLIILVDVLFLMRTPLSGFSVLFSEDYTVRLMRYAQNAVNLKPFDTIGRYLFMVEQYGIGGGNRIWWQNLAGNTVLFFPMGFLLPALFPFYRSFVKTVFSVVLMVICAECLQLLTFTGSCDVDDLILNTAGSAVGYMLWRVVSVNQQEEKG